MLYTNITNFYVFCCLIIIFLIVQYKHNECVILFCRDKSFSEFFELVTNYLEEKKKKTEMSTTTESPINNQNLTSKSLSPDQS